MFTRNRPPGGFTPGSTISQTELELWDANLANALDGLNGGAYALAADMAIGGGVGVDWTFDLPVNFIETATFEIAVFDSFTQFNELATFSAGASFGDDTFFDDTATFNIAVFDSFTQFNELATFSAGASFGDTAFFDLAQFDDDATFNADGIFEGDVYFNGTAFLCQSQSVFFGTVTLRGITSFTSSGKLAYRSAVNAVDANQTVLAAQVDTYYSPSGVMSADRSVTIDDTGASNGMRIKFWNNDGTRTLSVLRPGASVVALIGGAASISSCEVERIAGIWQRID